MVRQGRPLQRPLGRKRDLGSRLVSLAGAQPCRSRRHDVLGQNRSCPRLSRHDGRSRCAAAKGAPNDRHVLASLRRHVRCRAAHLGRRGVRSRSCPRYRDLASDERPQQAEGPRSRARHGGLLRPQSRGTVEAMAPRWCRPPVLRRSRIRTDLRRRPTTRRTPVVRQQGEDRLPDAEAGCPDQPLHSGRDRPGRRHSGSNLRKRFDMHRRPPARAKSIGIDISVDAIATAHQRLAQLGGDA